MSDTPLNPADASISDVSGLQDASLRASLAVDCSTYHEQTARQFREIRDEAIRELRAAGATIPEISYRTGVNLHTVKAILR